MLFGTTGWTVKNNSIFGNFLWGAAAFSDPTNATGKAENIGNRFIDNKMGAGFDDANGSDFYNDGSGQGHLLRGQLGGRDVRHERTEPTSQLYPTARERRHRHAHGDPTQFGKLAAIVPGQTRRPSRRVLARPPAPAAAGPQAVSRAGP